jgi:hypothetical protein
MVRLTEATEWHTEDVADLAAEIRRLWAERDARRLAGQPVSEGRVAEIVAANPRELDTDGALADLADLKRYVAFLERILADADDLPRVRAEGWRAGIKDAATYVSEWGGLGNVANRIRELAGEGGQ